MLIALGAALGVMLATMLLLGNQSVEQTVQQQVESRYGDYDMQFGYVKNDVYLTDEQLKEFKNLENAERISKVLIPYPLPNHKELAGQPSYWGGEQNSPDMASYKIAEGRYPKVGAEVAVTKAYADREKIKVGQEVKFPFPPYGEKSVKVVGILNPPAMAAMGHSAYFPLEWLQEELQLQGKFNLVQINVYDSSVKGILAHELKQLQDMKIDQRVYVDKAFERLNVMKPLLFSLGGISLFVVALLIMGSFFLSVRSRFKQWALLRAMGSNPNQVILVILSEALCIGGIGSLAGVMLGASTHQLTSSFINRWVNTESTGNEVFSVSGEILMITFCLGMVMSLLGALIPALIVKRIPPVQALRPGLPSDQQKEKKWNIVSLIVLLLGAVIGFSGGILEQYIGFNASAIGAVLFAVGLLFTIPLFIRFITPVLSKPLQVVFPIETTISSRNVVRYRKKAAVSVAILAFGFMLSLVGTTSVSSMYEGMKKGLEKSLPADLVIRVPLDIQGIESLPFDWLSKIKQIDGVKEVVAIAPDSTSKLVNYDFKKADQEWYDFMKVRELDHELMEIAGVDIVAFQKVTHMKVVYGGELNTPLADGEGVVTKETAENLGIKVNDTISIQANGKQAQQVKIVSIIEKDLRLRGSYAFVNEQWARDNFNVEGYESIQIMTDSGVPFDKIKKEVTKITGDRENVEVLNSNDLLKEQQQLLDQMVMLIRLLVGIIFVISGIGLMNAIVASLHERRAEISMIRAVGAVPKQMRKIVWLEGTLLGTIAGVIGIGGGLIFSYIVLTSLELTTFIIPYNQIFFLAIASILLGIGAAMIASMQLRQFKLSDTLKELSA